VAILERLYAPLVKKLNLTSEQSKRFFQVILENKMKARHRWQTSSGMKI